MSTPSNLSEPTDATRVANEEYPAPAIVKQQALLKDWPKERDKFQNDPDAFWEEIAKDFIWSKPWNKVFEWDGIHHRWFTGAKTNITINALDRHANSENRNKVAFIWLGEDGTERIVTYGQLFRDV